MFNLSKSLSISILLFLGLLLFPFGNLLRIQLSPTVSIVLLDCVVALIVLFSLPKIWSKRHELVRTKQFQALGIFYVAGIVGLLMSLTWLTPLSVAVALLYGCRFLIYILFMWICMQLNPKESQNIYTGIVFSGTAMAVAGIVQYLAFPDLRGLFSLGWDEHYFRLFGTLLDPNFSGAVFVITIMITLSLFHTGKILPRIALFCIAVSSIALLLTYSRSSYVMLCVSLISFYALRKMYKVLFLSCFLLLCGVLLVPKDIKSEGVNLLRTASITARIGEYKKAVEIASQRPVFGVGFNAYRAAQIRNGNISVLTDQPDHAGAGVPNSFLFVLATSGVVGLLGYGAFWLLHIKRGIQKKNALLLACCMGLLVHSLFENTLFYPFLMFQYMMILGMEA